jgi:hypothetical protein
LLSLTVQHSKNYRGIGEVLACHTGPDLDLVHNSQDPFYSILYYLFLRHPYYCAQWNIGETPGSRNTGGAGPEKILVWKVSYPSQALPILSSQKAALERDPAAMGEKCAKSTPYSFEM